MTTITSTRNAVVKAARALGRSDGRDPSGAFLVEGPQVLREARPFLRRLFAAEDLDPRTRRLLATLVSDGIEVVEVAPHVLASIAGTVRPQGLVGVAELPSPAVEASLGDATLAVVLDDVGDPGNLGTVIRSADAAGVDVVVTTPGSVDARNGKAVRASAGSLFHLPVVQGLRFDAVSRICRAAGVRLVAADMSGATAYTEVDLIRPTCLVLGSEPHGLTDDVLARCDAVAAIPMPGGTRRGYGGAPESLNLAATATLLVYEAARQRALTAASVVGAVAASSPRA